MPLLRLAMLQLTLLLLGDALSHDGMSHHVHDPPAATAHSSHHAKNVTSPGAMEREKRAALLRAGVPANSTLARTLKLESARREHEASPLRAKIKPAVDPLPAASAPPAAAAASPSPPPTPTSERAGLYSALLALVLLAVALLVPAKARLRLLTEGLGGMSAYAQQCCSFCVLVGTMTVAMLLFKLCQARAWCMHAVHVQCMCSVYACGVHACARACACACAWLAIFTLLWLPGGRSVHLLSRLIRRAHRAVQANPRRQVVAGK